MLKKEQDSKKNKNFKKNTPCYFEQINPFVAGVDIGSRSHFVAAPVRDVEGKIEIEVREFSVFTEDLNKMADWLKECNVTSIAMESTSVYWIPPYEVLESRGFSVNLIDARHVKNVTGRKTDVKDCQWIQQLHACGLLSAAFRPADKILPLRGYMRRREALIASSARCIQHMQKALTQMNLHLTNVLNDIMGLTGMTIIRAIVAGERDPKKLAAHRDQRCKNTQEIIEKSLTGNYREEHLFSLQQALESFDFYQKQILECDKKIEAALVKLNPTALNKANTTKGAKELSPRTCKRRGGNLLYFDPAEHLLSITGVNLTKIPGIETNAAVKILSEIGMDMNNWKTSNHFTSWLGLSPENKVSGGKRLSSRTKSSANRAAEVFRMAALSLSRGQTSLGAFFRRIKTKHGAPKAITATARKIAVVFYSMIKEGEEYVEAGVQQYEEKYKARLVNGMQKRASDLGYMLVPINTILISPQKMDKNRA